MRHVLAIFFYLLVMMNLMNGQDPVQHYKWETSLSYAYGEHDDRMFGFQGSRTMPDATTGKWGTFWITAGIHRAFLQNDIFSLKAGLGLAIEMQTYTRPVDLEALFGPPAGDVLLNAYMDKYRVSTIQLPIQVRFKLLDDLSAHLEANPLFSFDKSPMSEGYYFYSPGFSKLHFGFYALPVFSGLAYDFKRFSIQLDYRIFQWKRIDTLIFNEMLYPKTNPPHPRLSQKYETYNPALLRLSVRYSFGKKELKTQD